MTQELKRLIYLSQNGKDCCTPQFLDDQAVAGRKTDKHERHRKSLLALYKKHEINIKTSVGAKAPLLNGNSETCTEKILGRHADLVTTFLLTDLKACRLETTSAYLFQVSA